MRYSDSEINEFAYVLHKMQDNGRRKGHVHPRVVGCFCCITYAGQVLTRGPQ